MKAFLGSVGIVLGSAVIILGVFLGLKVLPDPDRKLLQDFQGIFGGLTALTAAVVGLWNVHVQIRANQQIEEGKLQRDVEALAGALAGELRAMLSWSPEKQRQSEQFDKISRRLLERPDRPEVISASSDFGLIYRENAQRIGILPARLPESVADLYGRLLGTVDGVRQLADDLKSGDFSKDSRDHYSLVSKAISNAFLRFEETAPDLIRELDAVRSRKTTTFGKE